MNYIKSLGCMAMGAALGMTSCSDFLDIIPLNEIVAENYWTEKADVDAVLTSCYSQMESGDVLQRMFVWGELRSDNIVSGSATAQQLDHILKENILEDNTWLNWQSFYQAINRCNTVIYYAPIVAEKDPNYTPSEVKANIAEATFLRTLAYFYLVRTFRDVPYTTKPSVDDSDIENDYRLPATPMAELLPILIADLEAVKHDALRLYPEDSRTGLAANTSRVTTCAIQALLADLYLWNKQYDKCIECCNEVFAYKMERYEELKEEYPIEAARIELFDEVYPLLMEQPSGNVFGSAYDEIFGTGNSFESIFELYFQTNQSVSNTLASTFYYDAARSRDGQCCAYSGLYSGLEDKNNPLFTYTDLRAYESMAPSGGNYRICKYVNQFHSLTFSNDKVSASNRFRSSNYANWIVYRLTDVMLMKAEAEVELGTPESQRDAFRLITNVNRRAKVELKDTLDATKYATQDLMRSLVRDERRRELLFEGKRWFDLVRYSLQDGNNEYMVQAVTKKQKERVSAITVQLKDPNALFWPYLERELDSNSHLQQNPAYNKNQTSEK